MAITGRIDLVHANDSRDPSTPAPTGTPTSATVRSARGVSRGGRTAAVPVVVETPGGREGQGADIAWLKENV